MDEPTCCRDCGAAANKNTTQSLICKELRFNIGTVNLVKEKVLILHL